MLMHVAADGWVHAPVVDRIEEMLTEPQPLESCCLCCYCQIHDVRGMHVERRERDGGPLSDPAGCDH